MDDPPPLLGPLPREGVRPRFGKRRELERNGPPLAIHKPFGGRRHGGLGRVVAAGRFHGQDGVRLPCLGGVRVAGLQVETTRVKLGRKRQDGGSGRSNRVSISHCRSPPWRSAEKTGIEARTLTAHSRMRLSSRMSGLAVRKS